jgi:hypothetical protein
MYEKKDDAAKVCELIARGYAERVKFSETETLYDIRVVAKIMEEPTSGLCEICYSVLGGDFIRQGYYSQALESKTIKRKSSR